MKRVTVTELRTHCSRLLEEAQKTGESIEVTKRGVPVAMVRPYLGKIDDPPGAFKDEIQIVGDLNDARLAVAANSFLGCATV